MRFRVEGDEGLAQVLAPAGVSPVALKPVAERLTFRSGAMADDEICVQTRRVGRTATSDVVFEHRITRQDGGVCAEGVTVRALAGGDNAPLVEAWG